MSMQARAHAFAVPRPAGMREVAERAGVAISSVSRVLSDHPDVSVVMRDRVLAAVADLGYEPDLLAQSMRTGATMTVGFVVSDIGNPLFAEIAQGAETALRSQGYSMLLANAFNDASLTAQQVRVMQQRRIDGLLLSPSDESDSGLEEVLQRAACPVALIDRSFGSPPWPAALSDHDQGMDAAVDHLVALGHTRIALVNGSPRVRPARVRLKALRRRARQHPGVSATVRAGSFSADHGERATVELMRSPAPPTALIAGSNQILVGVLRAVRGLGLRIPDDLSLVTCDDVAMAEFLSPALSTVSRDARQLGGAAADLLLDQMAGRPIDREVVLPTGFRPTQSCGAPPPT